LLDFKVALPRLLEILKITLDNVIHLYYISLAMKPKDIPEVITFRPNPEDRELLSSLIRMLKPRQMSMLIRKGLQLLLEKEQAKQ
jgi:hypothetical protein